MKKKLALKMDDLRVDTFTTARQPGGRGTVAGYYGTNHTLQMSCEGTCVTCEYTCAGPTCDYTCSGYATSPGPDRECIVCG